MSRWLGVMRELVVDCPVHVYVCVRDAVAQPLFAGQIGDSHLLLQQLSPEYSTHEHIPLWISFSGACVHEKASFGELSCPSPL